MNNTPVTHRFFRSSKEGAVEEQLSQLLDSYNPAGFPVRLVFFDALPDNETYAARLNFLKQKVAERFTKGVPVVSYVAQTPCDGKPALEVHEVDGVDEKTVEYKEGYVTVEQGGGKFLFMGGIGGRSLNDSIACQSVAIFDQVATILKAERMPIDSIVRQWNYIEKIVAMDASGHQPYQDFNDIRSLFYGQAEWKHGYPAATGIGTQWGGVLVDIDAWVAKDENVGAYPLDNPLQVPAHAYSREVLLGESKKSTPKFERGKAVVVSDKGMVYVSGTAAIRGEQSLTGVGIEAQTQATLENIAYLVSKENLNASGVNTTDNSRLLLLRVYLKCREDEAAARAVIKKALPSLPAIYVVADVCRDELLIEMEGMGALVL